jgi:CPA1 family monovalent cation:H+ antiporter
LVFLFIGLTITPGDLIDELDAVAIAVVGVVLVRIVVTYGLSAVIGVVKPDRAIPVAYQHVMLWGGLRGAISLALALTVTEEQFSAETVQTVRVMTFGVVLFTLLVQGTTIAGLIRRLGLAGADEREVRQQHHQAKIVMGRAGQAEIARLGADGALDDDLAQALGRSYQAELARETAALSAYTRSDPEMEAAMLFRARRDAINAERSALGDVVVSGLIDGQVARGLSRDLDIRVAALELIEERIGWDFEAEIDFADLDDGIEAVVITELRWLRAVGQDVANTHEGLG